jgi:hypothetical protein
MIRTIVAVAAIALYAFAAPAAQADPIADQCARATIPTALCNGTGGSAPTNDGSGSVRQVGPTKYYNGQGADVVIGYDKDKPLTNEGGSPKLDPKTGEQMYAPIMAAGDPTYGTKPGTEAGKTDSDGNVVRDLSGYQYK